MLTTVTYIIMHNLHLLNGLFLLQNAADYDICNDVHDDNDLRSSVAGFSIHCFLHLLSQSLLLLLSRMYLMY